MIERKLIQSLKSQRESFPSFNINRKKNHRKKIFLKK